VFAYGDPQGAPAPPEYASDVMHWRPAGRSRTALAAMLARELWPQPHVVLFTHVNLLRLAPLVRWIAPAAACAVLGHGIEDWDELPAAIRRELRRCVSVVAPSRYTRQRLIEVNGVEPQRAVVLHHGLAPEWHAGGGAGQTRPRTDSVLLAVTRMSLADAYKGVDTTIEAMPRILERCPHANFRIAGDGADRPRLEQLARERGVSGRVHFLGELGEDALRSEYERASVFVLPSRKEGFGIVFAEAMWHGLPVVAARAAGTLDVVEDEVTGILVPPDSPEQLASAVSGLLLLPEERARIGATGRKRMEENFLFEQFAARWHRWLAGVAPEAIYLARHGAAFTANGNGRKPQVDVDERCAVTSSASPAPR
jgi:glycosyltransferase involved in cell wall biosynthesis